MLSFGKSCSFKPSCSGSYFRRGSGSCVFHQEMARCAANSADRPAAEMGNVESALKGYPQLLNIRDFACPRIQAQWRSWLFLARGNAAREWPLQVALQLQRHICRLQRVLPHEPQQRTLGRTACGRRFRECSEHSGFLNKDNFCIRNLISSIARARFPTPQTKGSPDIKDEPELAKEFVGFLDQF